MAAIETGLAQRRKKAMGDKDKTKETTNGAKIIRIVPKQNACQTKTGMELLKSFERENEPAAVRLHLELVGTNPADVLPDKPDIEKLGDRLQFMITKEERKILQKFGGMENSISRDVIIPGQMTLHALNYVILQLFGWQNSHLHNFGLKKEDLHAVTAGNLFREYAKLCGIVFRFPDDDYEDQYWDDDYNPYMSLKTWMRRKYRGPYDEYGGTGEWYYSNQKEVKAFCDHFPTIDIREPFEEYWARVNSKPVQENETGPNGEIHFSTGKDSIKILKQIPPAEATLDELDRSIVFEKSFNCLLERLKVTDVLLDENAKKPAPGKWREAVELANYYFIKSETKKTIDLSPLLFPFTDEVMYFYDYGDDWIVRITCQKTYFKINSVFEDAKGAKADAALTEKLKYVTEKLMPVCVHKDGINVVDDVGGLSGFCEFLEIINSGDKQAARESKKWASGLGWTGRNVKPENML